MMPHMDASLPQYDATAEPADHHDLIARVRRCIADVLNVNVRMIGNGVELIELGADSFTFAAIAAKLDATFDVALPTAFRIADLHTAEAYVRAVAEQLGRTSNHGSRGGASR